MHSHSAATADGFLSHLQSFSNFISSHSPFSSSLLAHSQLIESELDPVLEPSEFLPTEVSHSGSSGPCSSYGSPTSQPGLMQWSMNSHSFCKKGLSHGPSFQLSALMDADGPARRAYSSGDLQLQLKNNGNNQRRAERACSSESSLIMEGMTRAFPYSPEEKRERIERYKTKRNRRNFNQKIKYECRKTLADSRRRIRGRFARNEETENSYSTSSPVETWSCYDNAMAEDDAQDDGSWTTFLDSYSVNFVP